MPPKNRERPSNNESGSKLEEMMAKVLQNVEATEVGVRDIREYMTNISQLVDLHFISIK